MRRPSRLQWRIRQHIWQAAYPSLKPYEEYDWRIAARDTERAINLHFKANPATP